MINLDLPMTVSDWDWVQPPVPKIKQIQHTPKERILVTARYTILIIKLLSDGIPRQIKDINVLIGCGGSWARNYLKVHGSKEGKFWRLK